MKIKSLIFIVAVIFGQVGQAADFKDFLKACGIGALIGAGVGVISLAAENKPSEHYGNMTRGASLGLYAGVAYGAYLMAPRPPSQMRQDMDYGLGPVITPTFAANKVDGFEVSSSVYRF